MDCTLLLLQFGIFSCVQMHNELCVAVRICAQTREELRSALEEEIRAFNVDRDLSSSYVISWNHSEFEVQYASLAEEIKIGNVSLMRI